MFSDAYPKSRYSTHLIGIWPGGSPNYPQCYPRHYVEDDDNDLVEGNPVIDCNIELLSGYGEEPALYPIDEVTADGKQQTADDQDTQVQDRAPHEE